MVGAICRYVVSGLVYRIVPFAGLPYGTLTVNILGCLLIGFLGGMAELHGVLSGRSREFLFIGVLGGFTTFSTFAYETLLLAREGETAGVVANVALHFVGCLVAVWVGSALSRAV